MANAKPTEPTASQLASVAPTEGTLKRSIQMKMFGSKEDRLKAQVAFEAKDSPTFQDAAKSSITVGAIVGVVYDVKEQQGTLPNGEVKMSLLSIGDFEATNYETGEIWNSTSCYLPDYIARTFKSALDKGGQACEFAYEVVIVPTGKGVPIAYEVRPLIQRQADNPINRMKLQLQKVGRLGKLPPPQAAGSAQLIEHVEPEPAEATEAAE